MQIRPVIPLASVLAVMLASPAVEPFSSKLTATTKSVHVAQLPAPTGHRQPTMNDLPPSLREEEKSGTEASPTQDPQAGSADVEQSDRQNGRRRTPRVEPDNGVPRICDPCCQHLSRRQPIGLREWPGGRGMGDAQVVRQAPLPAAALCCILDEASDTIRTLTWRQSGSVEAAISAALRAAILLGLGLRNSERTVELSI